MNAASPAPAAQPIPVFDLHCDTADRLSWQSLSGSLRKAAGMHFYGPGDEANPAGCRQLARNHGAISVEKVGATPWAQCCACFVPDELSPEEAVAFEAHVSAYLADQVWNRLVEPSPPTAWLWVLCLHRIQHGLG